MVDIINIRENYLELKFYHRVCIKFRCKHAAYCGCITFLRGFICVFYIKVPAMKTIYIVTDS